MVVVVVVMVGTIVVGVIVIVVVAAAVGTDASQLRHKIGVDVFRLNIARLSVIIVVIIVVVVLRTIVVVVIVVIVVAAIALIAIVRIIVVVVVVIITVVVIVVIVIVVVIIVVVVVIVSSVIALVVASVVVIIVVIIAVVVVVVIVIVALLVQFVVRIDALKQLEDVESRSVESRRTFRPFVVILQRTGQRHCAGQNRRAVRTCFRNAQQVVLRSEDGVLLDHLEAVRFGIVRRVDGDVLQHEVVARRGSQVPRDVSRCVRATHADQRRVGFGFQRF